MDKLQELQARLEKIEAEATRLKCEIRIEESGVKIGQVFIKRDEIGNPRESFKITGFDMWGNPLGEMTYFNSRFDKYDKFNGEWITVGVEDEE